MTDIQPGKLFTDIPCCWISKRYYDETQYNCVLNLSPFSLTTLQFLPGQPGLILQKYGFIIAQQVKANIWKELTYLYFGYYMVTLKIADNAIEGYAGKQFPISGQWEFNADTNGDYAAQTCSILNPSMLCDICIYVDQPDTPISVEFVPTKVLPDNTCILARIMGKYVE